MPWKRNPSTGAWERQENTWDDFLPFLMKQGQQYGFDAEPYHERQRQAQRERYGAGPGYTRPPVTEYSPSGWPTTTQKPAGAGSPGPMGGSTTGGTVLPALLTGMYEESVGVPNRLTNLRKLQKQILDQIEKGLDSTGNASGGGGGEGGNSGGWSPNSWERAFMGEHEGRTPREEYARSWMVQGNSLNPNNARFYTPEDEADWDRKWGEQFQRTYGKAPDEDDWKASYEHRNAMKYGRANPSGG